MIPKALWPHLDTPGESLDGDSIKFGSSSVEKGSSDGHSIKLGDSRKIEAKGKCSWLH